MNFQYDRFDIKVYETNNEVRVVIEDSANKYKRKLRRVAVLRRSLGVWVYEVRQAGQGRAKLWNAKHGAADTKQAAVAAVSRYIKTNIERGHADPNSPAVDIKGETGEADDQPQG